MDKKKILFIVSDFFQHGAQRQMYEIDKALDKEKFEVTLISIAPLNSRVDLYDYYYQKHLDLGTKIIFFEVNKTQKKGLIFRVINKLTNGFLKNKKIKQEILKTKKMFDGFNKVVFMGEYNYQKLYEKIPVNYFNEIIIFIMSSRFQSENYRNFDKHNKYLFASGFENLAQIEHEFEGFENYNHHFVPLTLEVSQEFKKWKFHKTTAKKIGIFTRLNHDKPLDPFFYAYQILLKQNFNIELHVFGGGDYKLAGYDRYLNNLDIKDNVYFRGHQNDMKKAILDENLDLIWFQGYNNHPAGYAAFEATLTGVPQIFWDFFPGKNQEINSMDTVYPHFKDLLLFVEANNEVLFDEQFATTLSNKQFQDVYENRDINKHIHVINNLLDNDDK